jgi:hypothetical protein
MFTQLEECTDFATAGGEGPAPQFVIRIGYNLILSTGLFETPCKEWRNKEPANKTMPAFQNISCKPISINVSMPPPATRVSIVLTK